ncbi:hypothetical protein NG821_12470 [Prevotella cerevisiae]|uniref:Uncharacterized protein n=1 Tax=Segatella cerevisiae TaxID=2053716 RepID=A0ABT1BZW6_9BACT|nr:hypothetical protein [Segatella cerevisiae]MCO6026637.1 hypothetical protein [Segatella cerevisiae]
MILSTGAAYHELGDQYVPNKIRSRRTGYLTGELHKLGYKVSLDRLEAESEKKPA